MSECGERCGQQRVEDSGRRGQYKTGQVECVSVVNAREEENQRRIEKLTAREDKTRQSPR